MKLRLMMKDGEFAKYWIGQTFSVFGSNVAAFALPLTAVYFLEASPLQVGLLQSMSGSARRPTASWRTSISFPPEE
ncbi:MAG TPA: hypothetical protein VIL22_00885 [Paenibacillaceae bacterium]